ncbi:hypothetical protein Pmar_PMAR023156 [Perkinsus marinus ATCC 50983]|uniref:Uncharacterized protein n=1 Tax=Perkinsus marinus (strain ATCC 50983 / TXsc) TaxID=423536 RepID=C5LNT1_PERM5|nr:hypothetical protein Pmar_PMAR023156 [Perkinsus marinus ATCC 50983]EER01612.1 hypothetical protein Pmar_PMAR023156 [Perkinsus marinus ATCC 50983]|eukprot:XP_002768894.1 hypothetical protein Pmar_PMAR023156 [Perkinsus marinus ATCC 50983]
MHQYDNLGAADYNELWRPYTAQECSNVTAHANCQYSDRISCLLINNEVRSPGDGRIPLYTYTRGGTIEDPDNTQVTCSYSEDGGTMDRNNGGCGCHSGDVTCKSMGYNNSCTLEGPAADYSVCWWGPDNLEDMMDNQKSVYNEVVISSATYLEKLPKSIQAFFFIANNSQSETEARTQYATFKAAYPVGEAPLLVLDYNAKENPFFKAADGQMYTTPATTPGTGVSTTTSATTAAARTTQSGNNGSDQVPTTTTVASTDDGSSGSTTSNAYSSLQNEMTVVVSILLGTLLIMKL